MPDPLRLQKRLIEILENAEGNTATVGEAKGELDDGGLAYTVEQIRSAFGQLVTLGRARLAPHAPGAPAGYVLVVPGSKQPELPAVAPRVAVPKPGTLKPRALVLTAITEAPGRLIDLAERTGLSQPLVGYHVKHLASEGKIERNPDKRSEPWRLVGAPRPAAPEDEAQPPPAAIVPRGPRRKASPAIVRKEPPAKNGSSNLRGAFSELSSRLTSPPEKRGLRIAGLKRKVAALVRLESLVPSALAQLLAEIREDLQSAAA